MLGRSILASGTGADDRVFVYEVSGLHQNDRTENNNHEIRHSSNVMIQVPFSRMSEFMQRMNRIGGKIVSIKTPNAGE
jgi:phycocyanin-associated, rod